jgi:predicted glycosyltransferase
MRIWIDLANSPQVLFFRPIITELERRGHSVTITSRHFAQTAQLADHYGMQHTPIGGHGGKRLFMIGLQIVERAWHLARFGRCQKFDLAVSHNSYAQALAAFSLRIPFVTLMDYEHQPANHLCFRLARRVIVPEFFPAWALHKYGATARETVYYHGLKEQVYLADFTPQPDYLASVDLPEDRVLAVMRPPGSWGLYHHFENPLFERVLGYVAGNPEVHVVFLPRVPSQRDAICARGHVNVWVPPMALDGPNLLYYADLVVSGGGTMNREAAVLGTPAYSVFKGRLAAVDCYLIDHGRMRHVAEEPDISDIQVCKKSRQDPLASGLLIQEIADAILFLRRADDHPLR